MTPDLWNLVNMYRAKEIPVTDEEAESVCWYCKRKMEVAGIKDQNSYLKLLFVDELKNYLFRRGLNSIGMMKKAVI